MTDHEWHEPRQTCVSLPQFTCRCLQVSTRLHVIQDQTNRPAFLKGMKKMFSGSFFESYCIFFWLLSAALKTFKTLLYSNHIQVFLSPLFFLQIALEFETGGNSSLLSGFSHWGGSAVECHYRRCARDGILVSTHLCFQRFNAVLIHESFVAPDVERDL